MYGLLTRYVKDEAGAGVVEYGLLLALLGIGLVPVLAFVGSGLWAMYAVLGEAVGVTNGQGGPPGGTPPGQGGAPPGQGGQIPGYGHGSPLGDGSD